MKSNLGEVDVYLHHETERAWLVSADGIRKTAVWFPKAQVELDLVKGTHYLLTAPVDMLAEKGLV